jgi:hypothetical protein
LNASTVLFAALLAAFAQTPVTLDAKHQLFLDDYLIASSRGVTREIHPAEKHVANPVLQATERWEGKSVTVYGSVIREPDKYRVWYSSAGGVGYAESVDGIAWIKPRLGVVRIDGQDTNLVVPHQVAESESGALPLFYEPFGVLRDDRDPDPSRRYKLGFLSIQRDYRGPHEDPFHPGNRRGLGVAASSDGLHWRLLDNWATEAICDGASHWMFDPARCKYVLYGRTKYIAPEVAKKVAGIEWYRQHYWGRSVARVESEDFIHWDITQPGKAPVVMTTDEQDPAGTEMYSMLVFPYESVYIGLVQIFHGQPDAHYLDIQLATSRDSIHFTRVGDRRPFLPMGPAGSWDRFNNSLATNPPIVVGDRLRFYYGGRTRRHSPYSGPDAGVPGGGIGLATIRRDRFVSLGASADEGQIVTRPLRLADGGLHLNATCDAGRIVVEVFDPQGGSIARSKPITADGLDIPVAWERGSLRAANMPVTLQIKLCNARLFALWCGNDPQ